MAILDEIRRRNIHRVVIGYLAGVWLLIQVIETLFPMFGVPDSVARAIVIILAVGIVPAVVLSWTFEWTPGGVVRDSGSDQASAISTSKRFDRWVTAVLAIAVTYFAVDKFAFTPGEGTATGNSIAVLPFVNMSSDPEQEYFANGISEELLNLLAKIPELRVISRSTSFTFKGADIGIPEVAAKMNVAHILEGSVRKSGDAVRITVQLIDAQSDTHVWSETYDRSMKDIFAIQDEISAAIVSELKLKLRVGPPTAEEIDPAAYTLYLQGREIIHASRENQYAVAQQKLEEAIRTDPEFVPAIWELARVVSRINDDKVDDQLRQLVDRMVEIAPDSSYANGWLASLAEFEEGDLQKAAYYRERAVADMSDWNGYFQWGMAARFMSTLGRHDESIDIMNFLIARDPACDWCIHDMAVSMRAAGRHLEAANRLESILEWHEPTANTYWYLGVSWLVAGNAEKALHYFDLQGDMQGDAPGENLGRILALYSLGRQDQFEAEFEISLVEQGPTYPEGIARIYAWSEQNDLAFEWLEKMIEVQGESWAGSVKTDLYAKLHSDPRWSAFLEKYGRSDEDYSHIEFNPILPPGVQAQLRN